MQKSSNDFTLSIIKLSNKPNFEKEHLHILELKNNSRYSAEYALSLNNECSENNSHNPIKNRNALIIDTEIYLGNSNNRFEVNDIISLKANESVKIRFKTYQRNMATSNSWNCTTISVNKVLQNKSKLSEVSSSESVTIKTFAPSSNNLGH
jgi:hypothetical protein